eukprot:Rhum_TRINITY_DN23187_c0_g1::Rhum_TRINITY_DN23187_c0_g1_i1::g.177365::m.177365
MVYVYFFVDSGGCNRKREKHGKTFFCHQEHEHRQTRDRVEVPASQKKGAQLPLIVSSFCLLKGVLLKEYTRVVTLVAAQGRIAPQRGAVVLVAYQAAAFVCFASCSVFSPLHIRLFPQVPTTLFFLYIFMCLTCVSVSSPFFSLHLLLPLLRLQLFFARNVAEARPLRPSVRCRVVEVRQVVHAGRQHRVSLVVMQHLRVQGNLVHAVAARHGQHRVLHALRRAVERQLRPEVRPAVVEVDLHAGHLVDRVAGQLRVRRLGVADLRVHHHSVLHLVVEEPKAVRTLVVRPEPHNLGHPLSGELLLVLGSQPEAAGIVTGKVYDDAPFPRQSHGWDGERGREAVPQGCALVDECVVICVGTMKYRYCSFY